MLSNTPRMVGEALIQHRGAYSIIMLGLMIMALPFMSSLLATFFRAPSVWPALEANCMCLDQLRFLSKVTPKISISSLVSREQWPKYKFSFDGGSLSWNGDHLIPVEPHYNEDLEIMRMILLYQVSRFIRVKKKNKSWDLQNYLVIRGFCYISDLFIMRFHCIIIQRKQCWVAIQCSTVSIQLILECVKCVNNFFCNQMFSYSSLIWTVNQARHQGGGRGGNYPPPPHDFFFFCYPKP